MRIYLNIVNSYLLYELKKSDAIAHIRHDGGDLVLVELPSGELVSIHLIERDIDVRLIKDILDRNTEAGIFTLLLLWCDMLLPEDGRVYRPYDWMSTLLAVYGDKIYAYELASEEVIFFPVYFEPLAAGLECRVRYGKPIDMADLQCETIVMEGQHINGAWRIADFDRRAQAHQQTNQTRSSVRWERHSMRAYYEILGIRLDADLETVKKAYRQLAREYHPDLNKATEANERMQEINRAYDQIMQQLAKDADGKHL